ncbi:hypothetical protein WJX72_009670 [[Myrmecia] bisecta]|uniref:Protein root UVB sensitive/RUS domain-containing protein n=1 Tax=[Myrmecia] bisecta TaxID=41462 RepID=A0AAW1PYC4_9CHLO
MISHRCGNGSGACKKRTSEAPFRPTNAGCHAPLEVLPVASVKGGRVKPYVWDGSAIRAVEPAVLHEGETHHGRLVDHVKQLHAAVLGSFLPQNEDVTPDYWDYARWRAAHRLFSSVLSIFATQSLLQAVGVGARKTLPAAAAINWVLKDGLGRLGRLTVAARFGQSFDADLKRFRWATSLLFAGCISLEYLTPLFPHHFLLLASVANVGKSIGLTTYISTQPAIQKSFARHENLADIMAKAQAQQMVFDNIGLAVAVTLTYLVRNSPQARMRMPLIALPLLLGGDLFAIYHELKSIHLRTLNKERAELIAEHWLQTGAIPSTKQVSKAEPLLTAPRVGRGQLRLQITSLEESLRDPDTLGLLLERHRKDRYMNSTGASIGAAWPCSQAALDASHAWAVANAPRFLEQLQKSQWQINPFLLSSLERAAYTELA